MNREIKNDLNDNRKVSYGFKLALCIDGIYRLVEMDREDYLNLNQGTNCSEYFYKVRKFEMGKIRYYSFKIIK